MVKEFTIIPSCVVATDRALASLIWAIERAGGELHNLKAANGAMRFDAWVPPATAGVWSATLETIRRQERPTVRKPRTKKAEHADACPACGRK